MILSHTHKFIMFSVQKTASESMEMVLRKHAAKSNPSINWWDRYTTPSNWWEWSYSSWKNKHVTTRNLKRKIQREIWKTYYKFCFVRNPWDRVVSNYFWLRSKGKWLNLTLKESILKWDLQLLYNQHLYIYDIFGNKIVNFVGRFENLQEDFNTICDRIGIERQELPVYHKSLDRKPYWEHYDEETKNLVAKRYAKDIKYFDYQFGKP